MNGYDDEYRRTYVSAQSVRAIRRLLSEPSHPAPLDSEETASLRRLVWAWECGDYDPDYAPPRVRGEVNEDQMLIDEEILSYALKGLVVEEIDAGYAGPFRRRNDVREAA